MHTILEQIHSIRIVVDFGLVVLIWMVQLIVYPGFLHYSDNDLLKWHKYYTPKITYVVAPMMFIQMGIAIYILFFEFSVFNLIYFLLVLSTWVSTFIYFVPLHQKIESSQNIKLSAKKLTSGNWLRTLQWSFIFVFGLFLLSS